MRSARFLPLRSLARPGLLALVLGLGLVWLARTPGETALIARWAAVYTGETGNPATDCFARPAEVEGLRLYVICAPGGARARVYLLNNRGRRVERPSLEAILAARAAE